MHRVLGCPERRYERPLPFLNKILKFRYLGWGLLRKVCLFIQVITKIEEQFVLTVYPGIRALGFPE